MPVMESSLTSTNGWSQILKKKERENKERKKEKRKKEKKERKK